MSAPEFVHLHVHSHYSILDAIGGVKHIVEAAHRFGMPAIALTDHGNMFGAIDFYQSAIKTGVRPIIGFEAYITGGSRLEKDRSSNRGPLHHLVLLAKNIAGYKNLVKLSTLGFAEGFHFKPRIDWSLLEKYHEGIIALSSSLQGEVAWKLSHGDVEGAGNAVRRYQDIFGRDDFYLEIQNHGLADQIAVLPKIVAMARACNAPIVATNDSHYIEADDWEAHDALLCMQTGASMKDPNRFRFATHEFYLKSPRQMVELFREFPEAVRNTLRVAEQCNVELSLGKTVLPEFPVPGDRTSESYLEGLCRAAISQQYSEERRGAAGKRLDDELSVIRQMGFCDYFLIVWDFVKHARDAGIPVGPGRGSAAGSIVNYLLRITNLDPITHGLLFERFLNPDRGSMPDIDIDFADEGRRKVAAYVIKKYGCNKASQIITFSHISPKQAIREIGNVLEMPLSEVKNIMKLVPELPGAGLKYILNNTFELKKIVEKGTEEQKRLLRLARSITGCVSRTGVHAAGIILSREPLDELVPMFRHRSGLPVTQYEQYALEKIGHVRMDLLGLKTLSIVKRTLEFIRQAHGIDVDLSDRAFDDKATYDLLCRGLTEGVFQLEPGGMRSLIKRLAPNRFEDIAALLALYRPGPINSGLVDQFISCRHGRKKISYLHPDLEPILKDTHGVFLYQEQYMMVANVMGGLTMGQADQLRRVVATKDPEEMERQGDLFVEGANKRGIARKLARQIFDLMTSYGEYCYNKSHVLSYAVMSYQTAWLKAHYPAELLKAMISLKTADADKTARYLEECRVLEVSCL